MTSKHASDWLVPLPTDPPSLTKTFAETRAIYRNHVAPTKLCWHGFGKDTMQRMIDAAQLVQNGTTPDLEDFVDIYAEFTAYEGNEEAIKLFMPFGIQALLTGPEPEQLNLNIDVLEAALKAGFWFWPKPLIENLRFLSARLFYDWFKVGVFEFSGWGAPGWPPDDLDGPGRDILMLCAMALIDPLDMIKTLARMHTPWADEALSISGPFTPGAPFYCIADIATDSKKYKEASEHIAAVLETRAACAILEYVTPSWLNKAFFRNVDTYPELAKDLSKFEQYYQVMTVQTAEYAKRDLSPEWPDLPII